MYKKKFALALQVPLCRVRIVYDCKKKFFSGFIKDWIGREH